MIVASAALNDVNIDKAKNPHTIIPMRDSIENLTICIPTSKYLTSLAAISAAMIVTINTISTISSISRTNTTY
jgi:hypothetical protein